MKPVRDKNSEPGSPVLWQKHQWQMKSKTSFFYTELHKDYLVQIIFRDQRFLIWIMTILFLRQTFFLKKKLVTITSKLIKSEPTLNSMGFSEYTIVQWKPLIWIFHSNTFHRATSQEAKKLKITWSKTVVLRTVNGTHFVKQRPYILLHLNKHHCAIWKQKPTQYQWN